MSQPWKLLPLAAIVAVIGALLLAPGGVTRPHNAFAELSCGEGLEGNLVIEIIDDDTDDPIEVAGAVVQVSPDPDDGIGSDNFVDNNSSDDSENDTGIIELQDICAENDDDDDEAEYTVELLALPNALEECEINDDIASDFAPEDNQTLVLTLEVDCSDIGTATPTATTTATVTTTAGPAATVTTSASPGSISCSGTSIVTIQVRSANGNPVPAGTAVTITTTIGSVSPSSGQTTDASGNAFVFLTAPANQGGTATVTAKSGSAEGSTTVTINCGTTPTPTTAPPPTVSPGGGVIQPPNTGSAGLADRDGGQSWAAFAGLGLLIVATAFGAAGIVKVRA